MTPSAAPCRLIVGVTPAPATDAQARKFTGPYERRLLPRIGHAVPQEAPSEFLAALRELLARTAGGQPQASSIPSTSKPWSAG